MVGVTVCGEIGLLLLPTVVFGEWPHYIEIGFPLWTANAIDFDMPAVLPINGQRNAGGKVQDHLNSTRNVRGHINPRNPRRLYAKDLLHAQRLSLTGRAWRIHWIPFLVQQNEGESELFSLETGRQLYENHNCLWGGYPGWLNSS